jgi:hypothetical protein
MGLFVSSHQLLYKGWTTKEIKDRLKQFMKQYQLPDLYFMLTKNKRWLSIYSQENLNDVNEDKYYSLAKLFDTVLISMWSFDGDGIIQFFENDLTCTLHDDEHPALKNLEKDRDLWEKFLPSKTAIKQIYEVFKNKTEDSEEWLLEFCSLIGFEQRWLYGETPPVGYKYLTLLKQPSIRKMIKTKIIDRLVSEYGYTEDEFNKDDIETFLGAEKEEDGIPSNIFLMHDIYYYEQRISLNYCSNGCQPFGKFSGNYNMKKYLKQINCPELFQLKEAPMVIDLYAKCVFEYIIPAIKEDREYYFINKQMRDEVLYNYTPYLKEYLNLFQRIPESKEDAKELFRPYLIEMKDDSIEVKRKKLIVLACGYLEYFKRRWPKGFFREDYKYRLVVDVSGASFTPFELLFSWYEELLTGTPNRWMGL